MFHDLQVSHESVEAVRTCHRNPRRGNAEIIDESSTRIVAADNRTSDLIDGDDQMLLDLLGELVDVKGTSDKPATSMTWPPPWRSKPPSYHLAWRPRPAGRERVPAGRHRQEVDGLMHTKPLLEEHPRAGPGPAVV